ncbi:MAG: 2-amino-4-hydroxy-6-hydroxymethyldihydropteridine diphosphokinase [Gammaproteobacteria bacterium]|nr:2-amino-4-hydroxy-6-hydroxymethyldihydropteridine diphosphokinase [Gammaproteobacteria bacterium]
MERESKANSKKVFLGIGSNIDKEIAIYKALTLLDQAFGTLQISPVFESEAIGFDGNNFYNLVISFETTQKLPQIIAIYKEIEDKLGRDRSGPKFSARTLDIDPLLYGDEVSNHPIILPREEILENAFVLWPLSLIAPTQKHPLTGKSYAEHWKNYEKQQKLWQIDFVWP